MAAARIARRMKWTVGAVIIAAFMNMIAAILTANFATRTKGNPMTDIPLPPCPFCATMPHTEANSAVAGGRIVVTDCPDDCAMSRQYVQLHRWNARAQAPDLARRAASVDRLVDALDEIFPASFVETARDAPDSMKSYTMTIGEIRKIRTLISEHMGERE